MLIILDKPYNKYGIAGLSKDAISYFKEEALKSLKLDMRIWHELPSNELEKVQPPRIGGTVIHYIVVCEQLLGENWFRTQNELVDAYISIGRYPYKEHMRDWQYVSYIKEVNKLNNLWKNIRA